MRSRLYPGTLEAMQNLPRKSCTAASGTEWTLCGLRVDCGLRIAALWLLTANRGNQERLIRMWQGVNGR